MEYTHELPKVQICFGYGIVFTVDLHVKVGMSDEEIKRLAIEHFKKYMPTKEQLIKLMNISKKKKHGYK